MILENILKPLKLHLIKLDTEVDQEFRTNGIFLVLSFLSISSSDDMNV